MIELVEVHGEHSFEVEEVAILKQYTFVQRQLLNHVLATHFQHDF
jgi:hypothetical protein